MATNRGAALAAAQHEAVASAGAGITVDSVFYALDSFKTQLQSRQGAAQGQRRFGLAEFRGLFRGFLPVVASGSAESCAAGIGMAYVCGVVTTAIFGTRVRR